jgi:hypothetical protein
MNWGGGGGLIQNIKATFGLTDWTNRIKFKLQSQSYLFILAIPASDVPVTLRYS